MAAFPSFPGAVPFGSTSASLGDGSRFNAEWHASTESVETVAAFYRSTLGDDGFARDGDEHRWRIPKDNPTAVLCIRALDTPGPHREHLRKAPPGSRTLIEMSARSGGK